LLESNVTVAKGEAVLPTPKEAVTAVVRVRVTEPDLDSLVVAVVQRVGERVTLGLEEREVLRLADTLPLTDDVWQGELEAEVEKLALAEPVRDPVLHTVIERVGLPEREGEVEGEREKEMVAVEERDPVMHADCVLVKVPEVDGERDMEELEEGERDWVFEVVALLEGQSLEEVVVEWVEDREEEGVTDSEGEGVVQGVTEGEGDWVLLTDAVLEALPERDPVVDLEGDPLPVGRGGVSVGDIEGERDWVRDTEEQEDTEGEGEGLLEPEEHLLAERERVGECVAEWLSEVDGDLDWVRDTEVVGLALGVRVIAGRAEGEVVVVPEALEFMEKVKDMVKVNDRDREKVVMEDWLGVEEREMEEVREGGRDAVSPPLSVTDWVGDRDTEGEVEGCTVGVATVVIDMVAEAPWVKDR
jgi:hypothetical protein